MEKNHVRDWHVDWIIKKRFVPAIAVANTASPTFGTLAENWSIGSSTFVQVPRSRHGAIAFAATTSYVDYLWRVPFDVDKHQPIYVRHHWTTDALGSTNTVTFNNYYATLTSATALTSSPTQAFWGTMSSSTIGATALGLTLTGRAMIAPQSTGLIAYQTVEDTCEYLHIAVIPVSTNWAIKTVNLLWLGMDIEYTPRKTFGSGNSREARKMETNVGRQEVGPTNQYGN